MFRRRRLRDLEERIEALEERFDQRVWELPPANQVPLPALPALPGYPDYTTGVILEDDYEGWNPTSYL